MSRRPSGSNLTDNSNDNNERTTTSWPFVIGDNSFTTNNYDSDCANYNASSSSYNKNLRLIDLNLANWNWRDQQVSKARSVLFKHFNSMDEGNDDEQTQGTDDASKGNVD